MLTASEYALYGLLSRLASIEQKGRAMIERGLPAGLTMAQFGVLGVLAQSDAEWGPLALSREFRVTKQTMTTTVARLERAGLIQVRRDPNDARGKLISLTEPGRKAYESGVDRMGPALALAAEQMPIELADSLTQKLDQLEALLQR